MQALTPQSDPFVTITDHFLQGGLEISEHNLQAREGTRSVHAAAGVAPPRTGG